MSKHFILSNLLCAALFLILTGCQTSEARIVQDFDFDWKFLKSDASGAQAVEFDDSDWRDVQLPHDWSIEGPYSSQFASSTGYLPGGIGWYRKSFTLESASQEKKIFIEFDGVYNNSDVWINGKHLGHRPYGYISFQYDLTPHVHFGEKENVIAVRVDHSEYADSRWYTGSGIYRHVRMTITGPLHIDHWGTFITTPAIDKDKAQVDIRTDIKNSAGQQKSFTLICKIIDTNGNTVAAAKTDQALQSGACKSIQQIAAVPNPQLWSPDSPTLYTLQSQIVSDNKVIDETTTSFGIRTFRFDPDKGFFLNGKNMKIKGLCLHHDGGPVGAAVPEKVWVRRFEAMKKIGCNAIRCSHNPPAPEFLDLCDKMGFLVQDEAFDEFTPPKKKWVEGWNKGTPNIAGYGDVFEEWAVRDIQDMVKRDRNHPSIIMWSIGNEVDYRNDPFSHPSLGDEYLPDQPPAENLKKYGKMLVDAVKEIDTTRPTTAALATAPMSNIVGLSDVLDIVGYNYQEQYYPEHHAKYPDRVLYGSENGQGYNAWKAVKDNDYISAQFLWTGVDYIGEAGEWPSRFWPRSTFDMCGFKTNYGWMRQSLWTDEPMVYIVCQGDTRRNRRFNPRGHWNGKDGDPMQIFCFTNCDEVELFQNGVSLGAKPYTEARQGILRWSDCIYIEGALKAVGKRSGKEVCQYTLRSASESKKITLTADSKKLKADGKDIAHLVFKVTDKNGIRVPDAEHQITFKVTGPAKIIALGNANPASHESHQGNKRKAWRGRGLAIIQANRDTGKVTVTATADGLEPARITLTVR